MKPAEIKNLRKHLVGQVVHSNSVLRRYASDCGVISITPSAVIYPHDTDDVQAVVGFVAGDQSQKPVVTLTPRGLGHGIGSGAVGAGAVLDFSRHMTRIVALTKDTVTVEAGTAVAAVQHALHTHRRRLVGYHPGSTGTVGGLVATNTVDGILGLKVILDDGSAVETKRISKRELNRKKGLMTREGDLYRGIDGKLLDHKPLIQENAPQAERQAVGYRLGATKPKDGSFNLSELFIGSEGTLGLITEVTLKTEPYEERTSMTIGLFDDAEQLSEAQSKLRRLGPSELTLVGQGSLRWLQRHHPEALEGVLEGDPPVALVIVAFNNPSHMRQNRLARSAGRTLEKYAAAQRPVTDMREQQRLQQMATRQLEMEHHEPNRPIPLLQASLGPEKIPEFLTIVAKLLQRHKLEATLTGDVIRDAMSVCPILDLSKPKERDLIPVLLDEFYPAIIKMGGSISPEGDGRLHAPYLEKQFGGEMYRIFEEVKQLADPRGIFNPGVIIGTKRKELESLLKAE